MADSTLDPRDRNDGRETNPPHGEDLGAPVEPPQESAQAGAETAAAADSGKPRRKAKEKTSRPWWQEILLVGISAILLYVVVQTFFLRVFLIPSESMEQTLHGCTGCTGDRIVVDRFSEFIRDPKPGDVVVFRAPDGWGEMDAAQRSNSWIQKGLDGVASVFGVDVEGGSELVKRVIATGGQTVQCLPGDAGITVDGKVLDEPYIAEPAAVDWSQPGLNTGGSAACGGQYFGPITVQDESLWVMGDNRTRSADSRFHQDAPGGGTVPLANVVGKARWIALPLSRIGTISDHNPQG